MLPAQHKPGNLASDYQAIYTTPRDVARPPKAARYHRAGVGPQSFRATIRFFRPERKAGLAVVEIPKDVAADLGGLKQMRVSGNVNGLAFNSNTMPAGGGVLALSLSQKVLGEAGLKVGDSATFELERA